MAQRDQAGWPTQLAAVGVQNEFIKAEQQLKALTAVFAGARERYHIAGAEKMKLALRPLKGK